MTDNWVLAADRIRTDNAAELQARKATELADVENRAAGERRDQISQQGLDHAIIDATQSLATFMEQRGEAAKQLLEARGSRAHVIFGVEHDGGYYTSVYLYEGGLGKESGYDGLAVAYSEELQKTPSTQVATPHDAAFYFAYYGAGCQDPAAVRDIVTWLTQKVDAIAAKWSSTAAESVAEAYSFRTASATFSFL